MENGKNHGPELFFLTYNVKLNSSLPDQGYFSGRGVGFNDGVRQAGSRQGVFRREGSIMKFWSLDDVTDGNMNYCETVMNLETETVEMTWISEVTPLGRRATQRKKMCLCHDYPMGLVDYFDNVGPLERSCKLDSDTSDR